MKPRSDKQKKIKRIIQIAGSGLMIVLFIFLVRKQDWRLVYQIVVQMPVWVVPSSLVLIFSGLFFNAWRWWILVRSQGVDVSFKETFKIVVAGAYASNFLPSTIGGDVFRIISMLKYAQGRVVVVSSVVIDRAINVAAYLVLAPFVFFVFDISTLFGESFSSVMSFNLISLKWVLQFKNIGLKIYNPLKRALKLWSQSPIVIAKSFIISWFSLFFVIGGVWNLARGIQIGVSFLEVVAVSVIVYILTLLPISLNGFGLREVAVTTLYFQLGANLEQASTLAIITRVLSLIATFPGLIWLYQDITTKAREEHKIYDA